MGGREVVVLIHDADCALVGAKARNSLVEGVARRKTVAHAISERESVAGTAPVDVSAEVDTAVGQSGVLRQLRWSACRILWRA